ncbi:probable ATP-dependent RNA helicase DDX10 [Belonocnema kinseyi]|uniref:probable ATP-dependent RNA helicase DDX10 n=1 Tax=Belonocnema kinseyi TaxID=2817044 RepID=UPI00143DBAD7|nr:probable ATP-dependent RNA helicase DDX10 [Belonocnema kinseyi]
MAANSKKKVRVYEKKKHNPETEIIAKLQSKYEKIDETQIKKFYDLPLSIQTIKGLKESGYIKPTDIQKQTIGLALRGFDILGQAKTGSGKTLAFLIPVIETLYCKRWTRMDGLGALIITPTRELACQIFETLRKVGRYHSLSAALVIGGKDLRYERERMDQFSILVLDEADRCLDKGFEESMDAIIENFPESRQTLLFSATQTKSKAELSRLSLKDPIYVSVHEKATHVTPEHLQQVYVVCNLEDKMTMLYSFLRKHLRQKIIVFFSTCKQVKFMYEAFRRLTEKCARMIKLIPLHGQIHQLKRIDIYQTFCRRQHAVLFATDVASRGLDFPDVDWVVQMDCPEDVNAYIHRAGRTARFKSGGNSLLVVLPSEENIIDQLAIRGIPISELKIRPSYLQSPEQELAALLARNSELKQTAQRSFLAYIKSVMKMRDKKIFNLHALDTDAFSKSLGLTIPPRIRVLARREKASQKKIEKEDDESSEEDEEEEEEESVPTESDDEGDVLTIKRRDIDIDISDEEFQINEVKDGKEKILKPVTKAAVAKKMLKKKIVPNKKINFDEDGQEILDPTKSKVSERGREYDQQTGSGINIELAKETLRQEDAFDKELHRKKIRERKREAKRKLKEQRKLASQEEEEEGEEEGEKEEESEENEEEDSADSDGYVMPDPDEIYGKRTESEEDNDDGDLVYRKKEGEFVKRKVVSSDSESGSEIDEHEDKIHRLPKRKLKTSKDDRTSKKKRELPSVSKNLRADEELALQLLRH